MTKFVAVLMLTLAMSSFAATVQAGGTDDLDYPDWAKCALDPRGSDYC